MYNEMKEMAKSISDTLKKKQKKKIKLIMKFIK